MFNQIIKFKFWVSGGIIFVLGMCFMGTMLKTVGITGKESVEEDLLICKARDFYLNGAYQKASDLYEKNLILEPDSSSATLTLAIIYDDYLGSKDRAVKLYKRYLELEPESSKKKLVEGWIVEAAQNSLGMTNLGNETYENKLSKLQEELSALKEERIELKDEIERLSGKLYNIQAEHQKEIQALQEQNKYLSVLISNARMRVSDLSKAIKDAEKAKKQLQEKFEKALNYRLESRKSLYTKESSNIQGNSSKIKDKDIKP